VDDKEMPSGVPNQIDASQEEEKKDHGSKVDQTSSASSIV
jgi:hypothetical protein